jgi:glycosyltransferase involved in cell wall biosynthesis
MRVLTAVPVYNEVSHISSVLKEIHKYSEDVLIVNDGSTDGTHLLLSKETVVTHEVNLGYGAAICSAFDYAQEHGYDVVVTIDGDGQHPPDLIPKFVNAMRLLNADVISGSRYLERQKQQAPEGRKEINQEITAWFNQKFGLKLTDSFCGLKAYSVPSLSQLKITQLGYGGLIQLWVQAAMLKWKIEECPVPLVYLDEHRSFGVSLDATQRRRSHYFEVIRKELANPQITTFGALQKTSEALQS